MNNKDLVCPRCEQDYVGKVKIVPLDKVVHLCEECDALWEQSIPLSKETYTDFSHYMTGYGYTGEWSLVKKVEE